MLEVEISAALARYLREIRNNNLEMLIERVPGSDVAELRITYTDHTQLDRIRNILRERFATIEIPLEAVNRVAQARESIEQWTGVTITIDDPSPSSRNVTRVRIAYNVGRQREDAERYIHCTAGYPHRGELSIPRAAIGHIIGAQRRRIHEIERESETSIIIRDFGHGDPERATVVIFYSEERQHLVALKRVRSARNNAIQTFAHPVKRVTMIRAGSMLDGTALQIPMTEDHDIVSFTRVQSADDNDGMSQYYKTCLLVEHRVDEGEDEPGHCGGISTFALQGYQEEESIAILEKGIPDRKNMEHILAKFLADYARNEMAPDARWRVRINLGSLFFHELSCGLQRGRTTIENLKSAMIGTAGDANMRVKFQSKVSDNVAEEIRNYLEENDFSQHKGIDEAVSLELLDLTRAENDRRINVDINVKRETRTLLPPNTMQRDERKPLFVSYQHAAFTLGDALDSEDELPHVPKIDMRLRLQTHHNDEVEDHVADFVASLEQLANWDGERLTFDAIQETDSVLLGDCCIRRIQRYSNAHYSVSLHTLHDEFGSDEHTQVFISCRKLNIRRQEESEIQEHVSSMLRFTESMLKSVSI